ncbi:MAG: hypothetical protein KDE09_00155 [Anaerolineales bacterium]|nr:hypothetical protein [Anaerolineales bacterium]
MAGKPSTEVVSALVAQLPESALVTSNRQRRDQGALEAEFLALPVVAVRQKLPGPDVWLVVRRHPESGDCKYYLSNALADAPLASFIWLSGMRWPIETCFEEAKQQLGLGDYQLRSWTGWHHHMTLCLLAHFFLLRLKLNLMDEVPDLTLPQAILLLKVDLDQPHLDVAQTIEIVDDCQRRHYEAYLAHRRRRFHSDET